MLINKEAEPGRIVKWLCIRKLSLVDAVLAVDRYISAHVW